MEWEFTPEQVVKGEAAYGLADFRRDLAEEVRRNLPIDDQAGQARACALVYDLCYALATSEDFDRFVATYAYDPPACEFLRALQPVMTGNGAMLGAILQRMIMDGIEAGLPLDRAVEDASARHARIVAAEA